ncbi:hypothetical protein [Luteimonas sp. MC1572]|uniref:hypothetical protein n=1 Tax=Luteimonas sp. MC1572 TaxID=2799325 RepID=UPI0018F09E06|nr:hypothetical protein [Luteimonas sp. MC1572]MBJ6983025.1 hypothetical protein [Luteimonas sp. MC1572]QQO03255.1 hypothetical protein JGR64_00265 [Luteimonas sp. MC1572]
MSYLSHIDIATALSILGVIAGAIGASASYLGVKRRISAERRLIRELTRSYLKINEQKKLNQLLEATATSEPFPRDAYEDYIRHIHQAIAALESHQRTLITRALEQPSESGRKAYVSRLIRETGTQVPAA